ncbi:MAG: SPASM domain-containing protein [Defluviitaleaceae bacterium]|nr:SPASM domain-containing protein [Defluviitaleaceae bacterium]
MTAGSKYGYVIPTDVEKYDSLRFFSNLNKYANKQLSLTIAPTLDCNMACPYCYEKRREVKMSSTVKSALCEYAETYLEKNDCKALNVVWYGGEPLLEIDTIVSLSQNFIKICEKLNIPYNAVIITNGVLLDLETALKLRNDCKIERVQITIDGMPEYHNSRRVLRDGRDSFDIILNNIEDCKDILQILVRVNVDKNNLLNIEQLMKFFLNEKKWVKNPFVSLAPVENYNENAYCSSSNVCLTSEEFAEVDYKLVESINDIYIKEDIKGHISRLLYPAVKYNFCGAVILGNYVVDPEGDLYTCWNLIGVKEKKVGSILNKQNITTEYMKWLLDEPDGKCISCNLLPICVGGCPYERLVNDQTKCEKRVYNFKEKLLIAYQNYLENSKVSNNNIEVKL